MNFASYNARFAQLSLREKVLVAVSSISFLLALFFVLLIEPLYLSTVHPRTSLEQTQQSIQANKQQLATLSRQLQAEPKEAIQAQLAALVLLRDDLKDTLTQDNISVLSNGDFSTLLTDVLSAAKDLQIDDFQLHSVAYTDPDDFLDDNQIFILKQQIHLQLLGKNSSLISYLLYLEKQPVALSWQSIEYDTLVDGQLSTRLSFTVFSAREQAEQPQN